MFAFAVFVTIIPQFFFFFLISVSCFTCSFSSLLFLILSFLCNSLLISLGLCFNTFLAASPYLHSRSFLKLFLSIALLHRFSSLFNFSLLSLSMLSVVVSCFL